MNSDAMRTETQSAIEATAPHAERVCASVIVQGCLHVAPRFPTWLPKALGVPSRCDVAAEGRMD